MICHHTAKALFILPGIAGMILGMLAGFVPQNEGKAVRRTASSMVLTPRAADLPPQIQSQGDGTRLWAVRGSVSLLMEQRDSGDVTPSLNQAVVFVDGGVKLVTEERPVTLGVESPSLAMAPLLPQDAAASPRLTVAQPSNYGDVLDAHGKPLRWTDAKATAVCAVSAPKASGRAATRSPADKFSLDTLVEKAGRYRELVEDFAGRYKLDRELVYAIIHCESDFSPYLVSPKSAMGLMQLLPSTARGEVHSFLYGKPGNLSSKELMEPTTNIRYGTAYLHILLTKYFSGVRQPLSREYCAIAAYNMGPNRFLRIFGKTDEAAVARINAMTPEALYRELTLSLPLAETRTYVAKVRRFKGEYNEISVQ